MWKVGEGGRVCVGNREKVLSIQTSFQGQVVIVGNANRKFVRQGQMALRASDGTQVYSSVQMFLFSDLLLIGVLRSDSSLPTYNLVAQIHLDEVEELRYDNAQQAVVINEHIHTLRGAALMALVFVLSAYTAVDQRFTC